MASPKPKPKPTPKLSENQKREETLKKFQESISPKGVAAAEAAAKKALEEKYPNMFIPGTRTTAGVYRSR
jgi:hypothetical protein